MADVPFTDDALEEVVSRVRKRFSMKPQVAFAGFGKSGKSSLFNAVYGDQIARVSMRTDETQELQHAERFGVDFTDTPGIGTAKFSLEKVVESGVLDRQHVIVHVLNGTSAIAAEDERLHEALEKSIARRVTAVNKADLLDEKERDEVAESVGEKLGLGRNDFLFVSAKRGIHIDRLVRRITDLIPDAMRDSFIAQQQADVVLKERRVRSLIYSKAALCAGVGAIPIPVADVLVITPVQLAMVVTIGFFHGVEVGKERALELMATLGAGVGFREGARQLLRLIPGYGLAISAGVAFAGTVALGEAANVWFKHKMTTSPEELQKVFASVGRRARDEFEEQAPMSPEFREKIKDLRERRDAGDIDQEAFDRLLEEIEEEEGLKASRTTRIPDP